MDSVYISELIHGVTVIALIGLIGRRLLQNTSLAVDSLNEKDKLVIIALNFLNLAIRWRCG